MAALSLSETAIKKVAVALRKAKAELGFESPVPDALPDVRRFLDNQNRIQDVWRTFHHSGNPTSNWTDIQLPSLPANIRKQTLSKGSIVVVLESPHCHEYAYCTQRRMPVPIGPAQNTTGQKLWQLARKLGELDDFSQFRTLPIVIANPVQWQCSLHYFHRHLISAPWASTLRDDVWQIIWGEPEVKRDFMLSVRSYKPSLVLNLCTGTKDKKPAGLNLIVHKRLAKKRYKLRSYYHPSSRHFSVENCVDLIFRTLGL